MSPSLLPAPPPVSPSLVPAPPLKEWDVKQAKEGYHYMRDGVRVQAVRQNSGYLTFQRLCKCGCSEVAATNKQYNGYSKACWMIEQDRKALNEQRRADGTLPPFDSQESDSGKFYQRGETIGKAQSNGKVVKFNRLCGCPMACLRPVPDGKTMHGEPFKYAAGCSYAERCVETGCEKGQKHPSGRCCGCEQKHNHPDQKCKCGHSLPKKKTQCSNCDRKDEVASRKAARVHEVQTYLDDGTGLLPDPGGVSNAVARQVYVVQNAQDDYRPGLFVRGGNLWSRACVHVDDGKRCGQQAINGDHCNQHGGGYRCESGAHMDETPPCAKYTLGVTAGINGHPRPDLAGTRVCLRCLKQMDPANVAVKVYVHKEHLLLAGTVEVLRDRGWGWLVCGATNIATHDCEAGPSRRRMDLRLSMSARFLVDVEGDEHEHADRDTSCEHAKLAGHLVDAGAIGMSKAEAELYSDDLPDDLELERLAETDADTPEYVRLRAARKRLQARLLRDARTRDRVGTVVPKLRVLRINTDAFVAADGTRVGSLFANTHIQSEADVLKLKPSALFQPAVVQLAERIIDLYMAQLDDAFVDTHKQLDVEYLRYSGCRRDGLDTTNAVPALLAERAKRARETNDDDDDARRAAYKRAAAERKAGKQKAVD